MVNEQRPSWRQILWTKLYDAVERRWGRRGIFVLASIICIGLVSFTIYKIWPSDNPDSRQKANVGSSKLAIHPELQPKEHYLLNSLAKFQRENGLESIALTAHGRASPNLVRADAKQPSFDFRTDLFGPPGPVSDDRPEFKIVLQNIPSIYLRHYKTSGSSFWITVTDEGYRYLEGYKD